MSDLIGYSVQVSMKSAYTASIQLTNEVEAYGSSLRWTPIQVFLEADSVSTCFGGNIQVINGLIHSVDNIEDIPEKAVTLGVESLVNRLSRKPLNTYQYDTTATNAILTDICSSFVAVPAPLYSFPTAGKLLDSIVVYGNNAIEEMKKIAYAGGMSLYVNKAGILTATEWKDNRNSVDTVIPQAAIKKAERAIDTTIGPSRFVVRGRSISLMDYGLKAQGGKGGNPRQPRGHHTTVKCTSNGDVNNLNMQMDIPLNVGGVKDGQRTNVQVLPSPGDPGYVPGTPNNATASIVDGQVVMNGPDSTPVLSLDVQPTSGNSITGDQQFALSAQGQVEAKGALHDPVVRNKPDNRVSPQRLLQQFQKELNAGDPTGTQGEGHGEGGSENKGSARHDEMEPTQITLFVDDPSLIAEFGIITEEINNQYLSDYESCFDLGVRKFQEFKMVRNSWKVSCTYLACLDVNQVVQFTTPSTNDAAGTTITGLLTEIKISVDPEPKAMMELTIESFEELGVTNYVSSNIIMHQEFDGVGGKWWTKTVGVPSSTDYIIDGGGVWQATINPLDLIMLTIAEGTGIIQTTNGYAANITQIMPNVEQGATYQSLLDCVLDSGTDPLVVKLDDGSASTSCNCTTTTQNFSCSYTTTQPALTVSYNLNPSADTRWYLKNPRIFKHVTR